MIEQYYQPGMYDVICNCRTQKSFDHIGNRRFRVIIENHSFSYNNAKSKVDKSTIVLSIFRSIQDANGNFIRKLRKNNNSSQTEWTKMSVEQSKEKIGHSLRDAIIAQEKDSICKSSRRDIYSVIGGSRTQFQRQNAKIRLISGPYFTDLTKHATTASSRPLLTDAQEEPVRNAPPTEVCSSNDNNEDCNNSMMSGSTVNIVHKLWQVSASRDHHNKDIPDERVQSATPTDCCSSSSSDDNNEDWSNSMASYSTVNLIEALKKAKMLLSRRPV